VSPARDAVRLYFRLYADRNIKAAEVVDFLRQLRRHLKRPAIVVLDRLAAHRSKRVRALLVATPALHIELLPPYAPELNPVEYLWSFLKLNPLANRALRSRQEVCKRASGGGLLIIGLCGVVDDADAVAVKGAEGDLG
jgi:transposase